MMVRFVRLLTLWNVVCSASLGVIIGLAVAMDLSVGGGAPLDFPAFVFSWAWLGGTPFVVAAALLLNRKSKWRAGTAINLSVGVLWIASVVYVFLMPCPSIWQNQLDSEAKENARSISASDTKSCLVVTWTGDSWQTGEVEYLLNGNKIGSGNLGFDRILEKVQNLKRGSCIRILFPYIYSSLGSGDLESTLPWHKQKSEWNKVLKSRQLSVVYDWGLENSGS